MYWRTRRDFSACLVSNYRSLPAGKKQLETLFLISRWWFQTFFIFTPIPGGMIQFDLRIFFRWVGSTINSVYLLNSSLLGNSTSFPLEDDGTVTKTPHHRATRGPKLPFGDQKQSRKIPSKKLPQIPAVSVVSYLFSSDSSEKQHFWGFCF